VIAVRESAISSVTPEFIAMSSLSETIVLHTPRLLAIPAVAAIGEGTTSDGVPAVVVHVIERTAEVIVEVPDSLDGHPVIVMPMDQLRRC
jgi:hypothetical protein